MPPDYSWKATFTAFNARYPGPQASSGLVVLLCVRMCASHLTWPADTNDQPTRQQCSFSNGSAAPSCSTDRIPSQ